MRLIFLVIIFAAFINICFAQAGKTQTQKVITICPFQIAENGKAANFRLSFLYQLEVGEKGEMAKITELSNIQRERKFRFVRDDLFVECMKKWHLEPSGKYFVSFYVGTTTTGTTTSLPQNYMRIVDPNKEVLIIELLLGEFDVLKTHKAK